MCKEDPWGDLKEAVTVFTSESGEGWAVMGQERDEELLFTQYPFVPFEFCTCAYIIYSE